MSETRGQPIPPPANAAAAPLEKPPLANDSAVASQLSAPATNPATAPGEKVSPIERVKGLFQVIHGSGETARGTINASLDSFGNKITGKTTVSRDTSKVPPEEVARQGKRKTEEGMAKLKGKKPATTVLPGEGGATSVGST